MKLPKNRRAFALVLVLIALVLTTSMAVFFLTSVARERLGVSLYATSGEVHQLSGMPVSRVMGQINAATKAGTAADPIAWASQPGMVRTYDKEGKPAKVYKLYSWDTDPEMDAALFNPAEAPAEAWRTETAHYVDINEPINGIYPIVDPRAEGSVDGFSVDEGNKIVGGANKANAPMPVRWLYVLQDGEMVAPSGGSGSLANIPGATTKNPIIGRVSFWTDDETCKVNINTASEGAFWDLPKSGTFEDMQFIANPPTKGEYQRVAGHPAMTSLSAVVPELKTSDFYRWLVGTKDTYRLELKDIYNMTPRINWGGSQGGTFPAEETGYQMALPFADTWTDTHKAATTIYPDADRLYVVADDFWFQPDHTANKALSTNLTTSSFQQRLFFLTANSRAPETTLFETPRVSLWPITWPYSNSAHRARNAVTRAPVPTTIQDPDTTALSQDVWVTAEERLLAFCATLNVGTSPTALGNRYYFQRQNPENPLYDWKEIDRNRELVEYVRSMMDKAEPGFGGKLSEQIGPKNSDWLALNTFDMSRSLVNQVTVPDLGRGVVYSFSGFSARNYNQTNGPLGIKTGNYSGKNELNSFAVSPLRADFRGAEYTTLGSFPRLEEVVVMFYATKRLEPELRTVPEVNPVAPALPAIVPEDTKNAYLWKNLINLDAKNVEANVLSDNGTPGNPDDDYHGYDNGTPGNNDDDVGARTTEMRAVMFLDFANMMPGIDYFGPTFWVRVKGASFTAATGALGSGGIGFPKSSGSSVKLDFSGRTIAPYVVWPLFDNTSPQTDRPKWFNNNPPANQEHSYWSLISDPILVDPNKTVFNFSGEEVTVQFYSCYSDDTDKDPTADSKQLIQEKIIDFKKCSGSLPIPVAPRWSTMSQLYAGSPTVFPPVNPSTSKYLRPDPAKPGMQSTTASRTEKRDTRWAWSEFAPILSSTANKWTPRATPLDYGNGQPSYLFSAGVIKNYDPTINDVGDKNEILGFADSLQVSTNLRKRVDACNQRNVASKRAVFFHEGTNAGALVPPPAGKEWMGWTGGPDVFMASNDGAMMSAFPLVTVYDTTVSMVADPTDIGQGDPRLSSFAKYKNIEGTITGKKPILILPSTDQGAGTMYFPRPAAEKQFHHLGTPGMSPLATGYHLEPQLASGEKFAYRVGEVASHYQGDDSGADFPSNMIMPEKSDWTTSPGIFREGGLVARPDQDYQWFAKDTSGNTRTPYYNNYAVYYQDKSGSTTVSQVSLFSPNRQIPSPINLLGTVPRSLETGWQTMVFNPNPANSTHPGLATAANKAPDHLYLDFFWMPVAEPYPISDQLSTAGKINLNYQIMPFPYINRKTGIHALMKSTWVFGLPNDSIGFFETAGVRGTNSAINALGGSTGVKTTRFPINIDETLKYFDQIFTSGDLFRSASQICEIPLIPKDPAGTTISTIASYWNNNKFTADNAREEPYDHLYSRMTTKSNTFTVHWRVQSLRKSQGSDVAVWDEVRDRRVSELRGSTLIERYIDPNATNLPDYAKNTSAEPLGNFYKWRVVSENYFQPSE